MAFSELYCSPSFFRSASASVIVFSLSEICFSFKEIVTAKCSNSFLQSRNSASMMLLLFDNSRFIVCSMPDMSNCNCISLLLKSPNALPAFSIFLPHSAILLTRSTFASSCSATSTSTLDFSASSMRTGISACFFFHPDNALENLARISSVDGAFSNSPSNGAYLASVCASSTSDTSVARRIRISR